MQFTIEENPGAEVRAMIDRGLDAFNDTKAGPPHARDLWVMARGSGGAVQGGLKGRIYYSWLFIDWLWVSPASRGAGIGAGLLAAAEKEAQRRACIGAHVDTFSFQSPDFYVRQGYEEFGRIDDFPPGHSCLWLKKRFRTAEKAPA
ncbi:GNAT superfamily N-acetyltransferase [Angulomicrobium tetraedrale]|uniref:GNAT superfamily N-acetyltransferase n=1 Tax=Ancylobacter tetraedralis TaxID=217068 RepID=A0A839ZAY1_9HYPH|nr:GNAT family N-acetyltransferase [Ancylobacter tetraedralis]MBB3771901.1 GNAT superfamily N-acetyltransferase [Ancylobacter tetraedralis]